MIAKAPARLSRAEIEQILQKGELGDRIAQAKARGLAHKGYIGRDEADDFEQELKLHLFHALATFDKAGGKLKHFIGRVVRRKALNLLRDRNSDRRLAGHSLDVEITGDGDGRPSTSASALAEGEAQVRAGRRSLDGLCDLKIDMTSVVAGLDPPLQDVCRYLGEHTRQETAAKLNISAGTLDYRIRKIRREFKSAGLRLYR
jgi:RNA polymerase sigma factor (sigma-70 family)